MGKGKNDLLGDDSSIIKPGDVVEYLCVAGVIHVKVLKVKPNGKLILETRIRNKLVKPHRLGAKSVALSKNVSVLSNRVVKL